MPPCADHQGAIAFPAPSSEQADGRTGSDTIDVVPPQHKTDDTCVVSGTRCSHGTRELVSSHHSAWIPSKDNEVQPADWAVLL